MASLLRNLFEKYTSRGIQNALVRLRSRTADPKATQSFREEGRKAFRGPEAPAESSLWAESQGGLDQRRSGRWRGPAARPSREIAVSGRLGRSHL